MLAGCGDKLVEARVGDSLLDLARQQHLEVYPATNLPPEMVDALEGPVAMRSREFGHSEWMLTGGIPAEAAAALGPDSPVHLWRVQPRLARIPGSAAPTILHEGAPLEVWDPASQPFPGLAAWYVEQDDALFALSDGAPKGVCLQAQVDVTGQLAPYEKLLGPAGLRGSNGEVPAIEQLLQQVELNKESRRSILLPAGAALAIPFESFPADGLGLAVGIVDRGFTLDSTAQPPLLTREPEVSDGAGFLVEVIEDGEVHEVWSKHLGREYIRWGYRGSAADLRPWRGKPITLRLRTDPGPAGDASFDYAVWSDLRLLAADAGAPARPHVVLIDIDTLRADRMSCYGHERPTTPRIDAWFARRGTRYEDVVAPSSWTLPSTASMLTGLAPHQHRVLNENDSLSVEVPTLATLLGRAGYLTYGVADGAFLGRTFGLDAGFDEHSLVRSHEEQLETSWIELLDPIRANASGRPVFLFLQTYLVHAPYLFDARFEDPQAPYQGPLSGKDVDYPNVINPYLRGELELSPQDQQYVGRLYDAGIARMDEVVGAFLEALDEALGDQEALVVLTSDHGEELFEHDALAHGHAVYEELLQVPLLVRFPRGVGPGESVSREPVSLLDLAPTVLDLAGLETPKELPGSSLLVDLPRRRVRVSQTWGLDAITFENEKLVVGEKSIPRREYGPTELYDLGRDPGERTNLADERAERAGQLERALRGYLAAYPVVAPDAPQSEISAEEADALRALGYLGDG